MDSNNKVVYTIKNTHTETSGKYLSYFKMLFYYKLLACIGYGLAFLSIFLYVNTQFFLILFIVSILWLIHQLFCIITYQYQNVYYYKNGKEIYFYEDYFSREVNSSLYKGVYKYLGKMNNKLFKSISSPIQYSDIKCFKMTKDDSLLIFTKYEYISIPKEDYSLDLVQFLSAKIQKVICTNETKQSINDNQLNNITERFYTHEVLKEYLFGKLWMVVKIMIILTILIFSANGDYFLVEIINRTYILFAIFIYATVDNHFNNQNKKIKTVLFSEKKMYLLNCKIEFLSPTKLYQLLNAEVNPDVWYLEGLRFYEDKRYLQLFYTDDNRSILFDKKRQDVDLERIIRCLTSNSLEE